MTPHLLNATAALGRLRAHWLPEKRARLVRNPWVWLAGVSGLAFITYEAVTGTHRESAATGIASDPFASSSSILVSVLVNLGLIIALIYGSLYLLRRWQGNGFAKSHKQIAVLESTRLSPRQALHLVRVGEQTLLIGATDAGLTLLTEVEVRAARLSTPAPFAAALSQVSDSAAATEVLQ
jgi:flagellar biosynthetic protein FliO